MPNSLTLVSIGPGDLDQMTIAARNALLSADVIVGYGAYLELIRPLLKPEQTIITGQMRSEIERATQAIDLAFTGKQVAVVSSGDIGIYAMAAPVFEVLRQRNWQGTDLKITVLPGVSAIQAGAAHLGGAISHDFCLISLSDLLTPWEIIEKRLWAAAWGDFVVALYNPRSKDRDWQLNHALGIFQNQRNAQTPVALIKNVTRENESIEITTLADFDVTKADMLSLVLIGNSQSYRFLDYLITPRGYGMAKERESAPPELFETNPTPETWPINLTKLRKSLVLVVGGGKVAERKLRRLLAGGAKICLISPEVTTQIAKWITDQQLQWEERIYQKGDLARENKPFLVIAATNARLVNAQIAQEAEELGLLCNVVDKPQEGNVHFPAVERLNGLVIAVSTEGLDPARARSECAKIAAWLEQTS